MKYELTVNFGEKDEVISVEKVTYQEKIMYEIARQDQYFFLFKNEQGWQSDQDHHVEKEWVLAIGDAIESHPDIDVQLLNEPSVIG